MTRSEGEANGVRMLHLAVGLTLTGQSEHIRNACVGLGQLSGESCVAAGYLGHGKPFGLEYFKQSNIPCVKLPLPGFGRLLPFARDSIRAIPPTASLIRRFRPTHINVHAITLMPIVWIARLLAMSTATVIGTFNNEQISRQKIKLGRTALRVWNRALGHRCVAISNEMAVKLRDELGVRPERLLPIDHAVHEKYRRPTTEEFEQARADYGASRQDTVICCVGRLEPRKNQEALVRALKMLQLPAGKQVLVLLAGPDINSYSDHVKRLAEGLSPRVRLRFLGHVDPRLVYWASDLNVLLSLGEGFGLVVIEGLRCGVPCIRYDTAGASQQIQNDVNGLVIKAGDEQAVAESLTEVLRSTSTIERWKASADLPLEGRFTLSAMAGALASA